ncbi:MAG: ferredoxin [Patescibacteria group bacterium]|nr:ferredoxin [Patescibacteria group bacterium]
MKKITIERNNCLGCGTCVILCPSCFKMNNDGRATLKDGEINGDLSEKKVDDLDCVEEAAQGCPAQCIKIT